MLVSAPTAAEVGGETGTAEGWATQLVPFFLPFKPALASSGPGVAEQYGCEHSARRRCGGISFHPLAVARRAGACTDVFPCSPRHVFAGLPKTVPQGDVRRSLVPMAPSAEGFWMPGLCWLVSAGRRGLGVSPPKDRERDLHKSRHITDAHNEWWTRTHQGSNEWWTRTHQGSCEGPKVERSRLQGQQAAFSSGCCCHRL